jgi:serine protease Do
MDYSDNQWDQAEKPRWTRFWAGLSIGIGVSIVALFVASRVMGRTFRSGILFSPPPAAFNLVSAGGDSGVDVASSRRNAIVRAVDRVAPAVVTISVTQLRRERTVPFADDPRWQYFFPELGREFVRRVQSMGSGFIVSPDGMILTNEHVIRGATQIVVNLPDGRSFEGRIFGGADEQADIAIVKIDAENLPAAPLGRSDDLMIGEWAIAIGNPFGYLIRDAHPTVTVGVISALNRDFNASDAGGRTYRDMIQSDASINPGNSGGPLVNCEGYVIGINTFIFSQGGGSEGVGFAIPIQKARQVLEDIVQFGEVRHNFWTGIHIQDVNRWIAESLGLQSDRGAIITNVESGSPGAKAGLQRGDVIISVNGKKISSDRDVRDEFVGATVGQRIEIKVIRSGRERTITLVLEELPGNRRDRG